MTAYQHRQREFVKPSSERDRKVRRYTYIEGVRVTATERLLSPPPGCIDVWQISAHVGGGYRYYGIFKDYEKGIETALHMYKNGFNRGHQLTLQHKAAIELSDGKFHLIHFNAIKWRDDAPTTNIEEDEHARNS